MKLYIFFLLFSSHILGLEHCPELSAHPTSKTTYIQMVHGIAIHRDCPPSTIYYQELCRCDHLAAPTVGRNIQVTTVLKPRVHTINTDQYLTVQGQVQPKNIAVVVNQQQKIKVPVRKKTVWIPVQKTPNPVISRFDKRSNIVENGGIVVPSGNASNRYSDAHQAFLDILNGGRVNKPTKPKEKRVRTTFSHVVNPERYKIHSIPTTPSSLIIRALLPTTPRPIEIRVDSFLRGKSTSIDATNQPKPLTHFVRPYSITRQQANVQQTPEQNTYTGIQEPRTNIELVKLQESLLPQIQQSTLEMQKTHYGRTPHEPAQNQNQPQAYEWKTIPNDKTAEVIRIKQEQRPSYVQIVQPDQRTQAETLTPLVLEQPLQQISLSGTIRSHDMYNSRKQEQNIQDIIRKTIVKAPSPIIENIQTTTRRPRYRPYQSQFRIQQQEPQTPPPIEYKIQTTPLPLLYEQTTKKQERKRQRKYGEYQSYRFQQQEPQPTPPPLEYKIQTPPPPLIYEQTTKRQERKRQRQYGEYQSQYSVQQQEFQTPPPPLIYAQTTKKQEQKQQRQYGEYQSNYRFQHQDPIVTEPPVIFDQTTKAWERNPYRQYGEYQYNIQQDPQTTQQPLIYEQTTKQQERKRYEKYGEYQSRYRIQPQILQPTPPPVIYEWTTKIQEISPNRQYVEYQTLYQDPQTTTQPLIYEQTTKQQERKRNRKYGEYQSYRYRQQEPQTTPPPLEYIIQTTPQPLIYKQTTKKPDRKRQRKYGEYQSYRYQQQEPQPTPPPVIYEQTTKIQEISPNRQYVEYQTLYQDPQTTPRPLIYEQTTKRQERKRHRKYGEFQSYRYQQQEPQTTQPPLEYIIQTTPKPLIYEQTNKKPDRKRQRKNDEYQSRYRIQQQEPQPTPPPVMYEQTTQTQEIYPNRQNGEYQTQHHIQQDPQTTQTPLIYEQTTKRQERKRHQEYNEYRYLQQESQTAPPVIYEQKTKIQEISPNRQYVEYQTLYQDPQTTPPPLIHEQTTKRQERKRNQENGEYQSYRYRQQESQTSPPALEYKTQTTPQPLIYEQTTKSQERKRHQKYGEYQSYDYQQQELQTAPPQVINELPTQNVGEYQSQYGIQQDPQTMPQPLIYEQTTKRQERKRHRKYDEYQSYRHQQQEPQTAPPQVINELPTPVQDLQPYQNVGEYQSQYGIQQQEFQTTLPPVIYEQTTQRQERQGYRQYGEYQSHYRNKQQAPQTTPPSVIYEQVTQGQEPERYQEYRYNFKTTTPPASSNPRNDFSQNGYHNQPGRLQIRQGQTYEKSNHQGNIEKSQSTHKLNVMQNSYPDMNLYTEILPTDGYGNIDVIPDIQPLQYQIETIDPLNSQRMDQLRKGEREYTRQRHANQKQSMLNKGSDQLLLSNSSPQQGQRPIAADQFQQISETRPQKDIRQSSNDPELDIRRHRRRRVRPTGTLPRYRHQQDLTRTDQATSDDRRLNTSTNYNPRPVETRQNTNPDNGPIVSDDGQLQNQGSFNSYGQSNVETQYIANNPPLQEYGQVLPPSNNNENIHSHVKRQQILPANENIFKEPGYLQTNVTQIIYDVATEPSTIPNAPYSDINRQQPQPVVQYASNPQPVPDLTQYTKYQPDAIIDTGIQQNQQTQYSQSVLEPLSNQNPLPAPYTDLRTGQQSSTAEQVNNRDLPIGPESSINRFRLGIRRNTEGSLPATIVSHSDGYAVSVSGTDSALQVQARPAQGNTQDRPQQRQYQEKPSPQVNPPYGLSNNFQNSPSNPQSDQRQSDVLNQYSNTVRIVQNRAQESNPPQPSSLQDQIVLTNQGQTSYIQQTKANRGNQNILQNLIRINTNQNNTDRFAYNQPQPSPAPYSTQQLSDTARSSNPSSNTYTIQISHDPANKNSNNFQSIDFRHDTSIRTRPSTNVGYGQSNINSNSNIQDVPQRSAIGPNRNTNNRLRINSFPSQMLVVNPTVNPVAPIPQAPAKQPIFVPSIFVNPTAPPAPTPRSWTNNRINTGLPNPPRQGYQNNNPPQQRIQINAQIPSYRTVPAPKLQVVSRPVTYIQQSQGRNSYIRTPGNPITINKPIKIVVPRQVVRQAVPAVSPTQATRPGPAPAPATAPHSPSLGPPVWKPDPNVHWRTNIAQMEASDAPDMTAVSFINHLLANQPGLTHMDRLFLQELVA